MGAEWSDAVVIAAAVYGGLGVGFGLPFGVHFVARSLGRRRPSKGDTRCL